MGIVVGLSGKGVNPSEIAGMAILSRQTVYSVNDDLAGAERRLAT
jgi:hypothetical protein